MSTETTTDNNPLPAAAETAWLEYAKGTYSNTDKRIFVEGFHRGWQGRREQALKKLPQSYTGTIIYCWVCRTNHIDAAKFCPAMWSIA